MEYEHRTLEGSGPANAQQLDEYANEGWLLIQILEWQGKLIYYFRREKGIEVVH